MASLREHDEDWEDWEKSKNAPSVGFDFEDQEFEFVSFEKIEQAKQEQLTTPTRSAGKSSKSSLPTIKTVITNIFIQRDNIQSYNCYYHPEVEKSVHDSTENITTAVRGLVLGSPTTLDHFKALSEKLEALDEALRWHDGNAIFAVISFLKKTLKPSIFNKEIVKRPDALNHYLKLLTLQQDFTQLSDFLSMLGRNEDYVMILYKNLGSSKTNPQSKLQELIKFYRNHIKSNPDLVFIDQCATEQIKLLEHQLPIEENDIKTENEKKNLIFLEFPRITIPGHSLLSTLYYCCLYHYHLPENDLASPLLLKKLYNLSDKQYTWSALKALIDNKLWKDIEALFRTKTWISGVKMNCCIGFDKVVQQLHKNDAPIEEVEKYLNILDSSQRLELAKKFKYHRIVVDTLVALRDRVELQVFCNQLIPNSYEHRYASESLQASSIKWKN